MILKNILAAGARGLISYLSRPEADLTNHINELRIPLLHQSNAAIDFRARSGQPATEFSSMPTLSSVNLVFGQHRSQVLLHQDAPNHLEPKRAERAESMRRPANQLGRTGRQNEQRPVEPFVTNMAGKTPRELAAEVGVLRRLRPNLKKAVSHLVLAHDPNQRKLTEEEWKESIKIALQAHGADQAAFAAWRHYDTGDRDHVHILYSRILPSGDVVSDSHNYRKNEAAARLIERTLMLDSPTPTPAKDRPGDRQAFANSARRAERRGTPDPRKIDAEKIHKALGKSRNHAYFLRLLDEMDIEAEFQRRGERQEIYGWKLRQRGSEEWIKASTLHKTLSWPQIKHYFADDISVREINAEAPQHLEVVPDSEAANSTHISRAPVMTRNALMRVSPHLDGVGQRAAVASRAEAEVAESSFSAGLTRLSNRADELAKSHSNLVKLNAVLLRLGVECAHFAAGLLDAIFRFIKNLLRLLGVGLHQVPSAPTIQNAEHAVVPQLEYQPYLLNDKGQNSPVQDVDSAATEAVQHVVDCISTGRLEDLPQDVEGREELISALQAGGVGGAVAAADVAPLDALFAGHDVSPAARVEGVQTQVQEQPDPFASLSAAISKYVGARNQLLSAQVKESVQVAAAQQAYFRAKMAIEKAQEQHKFEHQLATFKFLFPSFEKFAASQIESMAVAEKQLELARKKYPPVVPNEVVRAANDQLKLVVGIGEAVIEQLKVMARIHTDGALAQQVKGAAHALEGSLNDLRNVRTTSAAAAVQKAASEASVALNDADATALRKVAARLEDAAARERQARSIDQTGDLRDAPRPVL